MHGEFLNEEKKIYSCFFSQKTIVSFADGHRLISKGSVFFCPTEGNTGDVQVFCCGSDFCNSSIRLSVSMLVLYQLFYILIRTYL
jgi:hypothetical protein